MSNKKSIKKSNKKSTKKEAALHAQKIESVGEFDANFKQIFWVAVIIILVFCGFYFLTVYLTGRGDSTSTNTTTSDGSISYTDIMAGRSFSMPENEYLVVYYDREDSDVLTTLSTAVSSYRLKEKHLTIYTVDMSNSFNKVYVSEESNPNPAEASELKVNGDM